MSGVSKSKNQKPSLLLNVILIIAVIALAAFPLMTLKTAEFSGSDDQAKDAIAKVDPNYHQWFHSLWEPPSGEIESLLFALQAAFGSGIVFYYLGYMKGRSEKEK